MDGDIHLLYVDKSKTAHRLLEKAVSQVAYVTCVGTLAEGLYAAVEGAYNFIVSDYELPDGNGLQLAERLRATDQHTETPMLLYTAGLNNELAYQAMRAGYHDSLQKPMDMMSLTQRIVELVEVPEVKRVERRIVQIGCLAWDADERYYEYSADLNIVIHGKHEDRVRDCMQRRLQDMLSADPRAADRVVDPLETRQVKHVLHFDV